MAPTDSDALKIALAQFNQGLEVQRSEERAQRAIGKAERAKQTAAAALKKLESDPDASSEDRAEAEANYRAAVDEWNRLRSGDSPPEEAAAEPATDDESARETTSDETSNDDSPPEDPPEEPAELQAS